MVLSVWRGQKASICFLSPIYCGVNGSLLEHLEGILDVVKEIINDTTNLNKIKL